MINLAASELQMKWYICSHRQYKGFGPQTNLCNMLLGRERTKKNIFFVDLLFVISCSLLKNVMWAIVAFTRGLGAHYFHIWKVRPSWRRNESIPDLVPGSTSAPGLLMHSVNTISNDSTQADCSLLHVVRLQFHFISKHKKTIVESNTFTSSLYIL